MLIRANRDVTEQRWLQIEEKIQWSLCDSVESRSVARMRREREDLAGPGPARRHPPPSPLSPAISKSEGASPGLLDTHANLFR